MPENEELKEEEIETQETTEEVSEEIAEEVSEEAQEEPESAMEREIAAAKAEFEASKPGMSEQPFKFPQAAKAESKSDSAKNIERLLDVEMNVTVRFGLTEMPLRDVVKFGIGTMIELNRTIDEPVELLVNNYPFARGEVVVIDGYYGVRVTEIGTQEERSRTLLSNNN
ncbi:MAG TPA: flagellar motor switch protein FliN [Pyrinomonadaceae bacterium]|nr:flagellar motor switch protein FliN [Pyrinomonadaceae bacterium]